MLSSKGKEASGGRTCESAGTLNVAQAAKEGRLSYHEAYQLTGIYGSTFDKFIAPYFTDNVV